MLKSVLASRAKERASPAVGNSPLNLDESPFRRIRQMFEPRNVVLNLEEFSEMEISSKIRGELPTAVLASRVKERASQPCLRAC